MLASNVGRTHSTPDLALWPHFHARNWNWGPGLHLGYELLQYSELVITLTRESSWKLILLSAPATDLTI